MGPIMNLEPLTI